MPNTIHVSCVMATCDRPQFIKRAIRYFLKQTFTDSELIIVDDSAESTEYLCFDNPRLKYIRLKERKLLGTKMNIGIEHARGRIIQKLDDDDYYHPDFLKTALTYLNTSDATRNIVAWDCFMVFLAGESKARFSGYGWAAGGTLCFSRELWEKVPFRDVRQQVDYFFNQDHNNSIIRVHAPEKYMLVRHGHNTWRRMIDGKRTDAAFQSLPMYQTPLSELLDPEDLNFYLALPPIAIAPGDVTNHARGIIEP